MTTYDGKSKKKIPIPRKVNQSHKPNVHPFVFLWPQCNNVHQYGITMSENERRTRERKKRKKEKRAKI